MFLRKFHYSFLYWFVFCGCKGTSAHLKKMSCRNWCKSILIPREKNHLPELMQVFWFWKNRLTQFFFQAACPSGSFFFNTQKLGQWWIKLYNQKKKNVRNSWASLLFSVDMSIAHFIYLHINMTGKANREMERKMAWLSVMVYVHVLAR